MIERRCDGLACEAMGHAADCEPQEGAPSCDSELAAIRRCLETYDLRSLRQAARDLLRMVESLSDDLDDVSRKASMCGVLALENSDLRAKLEEAAKKLGQERTECEVLRAKLTELDKLYRDHIDQSCAAELELEAKLAEMQRWHESAVDAEAKRSAECRELEAKLAEAEKQADRWNGECAAQREIARLKGRETYLQDILTRYGISMKVIDD